MLKLSFLPYIRSVSDRLTHVREELDHYPQALQTYYLAHPSLDKDNGPISLTSLWHRLSEGYAYIFSYREWNVVYKYHLMYLKNNYFIDAAGSFKERIRFHIASIFAESHLSTKRIKRAINDSFYKDELAKRKIFNPFKWIEFLYALVYEAVQFIFSYLLPTLALIPAAIFFIPIAVLIVISKATTKALHFLEAVWNDASSTTFQKYLAAVAYVVSMFVFQATTFLIYVSAALSVLFLKSSRDISELCRRIVSFALRAGSYVIEGVCSPLDAWIKPGIRLIMESPAVGLMLLLATLLLTISLVMAAGFIVFGLPASALLFPNVMLLLQSLNIIPLMGVAHAWLALAVGTTIGDTLLLFGGLFFFPVVVRAVFLTVKDFASTIKHFFMDINISVGFEDKASSNLKLNDLTVDEMNLAKVITHAEKDNAFSGSSFYAQAIHNLGRGEEAIEPDDRGGIAWAFGFMPAKTAVDVAAAKADPAAKVDATQEDIALDGHGIPQFGGAL